MGGTARHRHRPTRSPVRRSAAVLGLLLAIVAIAVAGTLFAVSERLGDDVVRVPDPFTALDPATRPARTSLLVGIDARSAEPTTGDAAKGSGTRTTSSPSRSDTANSVPATAIATIASTSPSTAAERRTGVRVGRRRCRAVPTMSCSALVRPLSPE